MYRVQHSASQKVIYRTSSDGWRLLKKPASNDLLKDPAKLSHCEYIIGDDSKILMFPRSSSTLLKFLQPNQKKSTANLVIIKLFLFIDHIYQLQSILVKITVITGNPISILNNKKTVYCVTQGLISPGPSSSSRLPSEPMFSSM